MRSTVVMALFAAGLQAQEASIEPIRPVAPIVVRPYRAAAVPPIRLSNSPRLAELMRAGTLYLTVQDAIALALDNNIDLEVARYNPIASLWALERAQAGGALPGVPSGASQAGTVAAGQGVAGSQAAAGVSINGGNLGGTRTANATITQIGPVTQTLDPILQDTSTFSHTSVPQPDVVQSLTPVLVSNTRAHNVSYQQGFLTGGSVTVNYSEHYLNENAPTDVLNPSVAASLSVSFQHNLLRGFGTAVNARTITLSRMNVNISQINYKSQMTGIVAQVLNLYYSLVGEQDDIRAKKTALETANSLNNEMKRRVELGSAAGVDLIASESQVTSAQQALVDSQARFDQQQLQFKAVLSRTGVNSPEFARAPLVLLDRPIIPERDDLPPLDALVRDALANRTDLAAERANLETSQVSALGTTNGLLPNLQVFGAESVAGLAGKPRTVFANGFIENADPYFVGGLGDALGQVFRRNFPTQRVGAFFQAQIHNWQAQADYGIDQLQLRQSQLLNQKDANQVGVDVLNSVTAVHQARARYEAAVQNRILEERLLAAEQRRFELGASTPLNVAQQQRDLVTSQSGEIAALVAYNQARVTLDQTLGRTLEVNHVAIR